jgi:hypothetical protein
MKSTTLITLVIAGLAASLVAAADPPLARFGWFAEVVGYCWTGTFPDGKTQHSHCYTSQFDQFIRGTATLSGEHDGRREAEFHGDSMFAWNEQDKRIEYYIWGSDGSHGKLDAYYAGDELVFPVQSRKDPTKLAFRSVWRRIDESSIEVRREVPDGEGWKTELTILYRRSAPQAAKQPAGA